MTRDGSRRAALAVAALSVAALIALGATERYDAMWGFACGEVAGLLYAALLLRAVRASR